MAVVLAAGVGVRVLPDKREWGLPHGGEVVARFQDGGGLRVEELGDAGPAGDEGLGVWKALQKPVRIEATGGRLLAPAKITFRVPAGLDPEVDPGRDVAVAVRDSGTGGAWELVGGDYDPATRTISLRTRHFSDWVPVVLDVAKFTGELAAKVTGHLEAFLRFPLGAPRCEGEALRVDVQDAVTPPLAACLVPAQGQYLQLKVGNPHGFPIVLELPSAVKAQWQQQGMIVNDAWALAVEKIRGGNPTLRPESIREFTVDSALISQGDTLRGSVDLETFTYDMVSVIVEFYFGKYLSYSVRENSGLEKAAEAEDVMNCVYAGTNQVYQAVEGRFDLSNPQWLGNIGRLIEDCFGALVDAATSERLKQLGIFAASTIGRRLLGGLGMIFKVNLIREKARELFATANVLLSQDGYHPTVALRPHLAASGTTTQASVPSRWFQWAKDNVVAVYRIFAAVFGKIPDLWPF